MALDITSIIDNGITEEKWYAGIIRKLVNGFELSNGFDLGIWWRERSFLSCVQRFSEFIETIVLAQPDRYFVVFIDEIDSILKLDFSTDDFFAYIRSCWNERADKPEYRRLTFAILGVAEPSDLMQDRQRTPFNIGRAIELNGFTFEEAQPLIDGLITTAENPQVVLQEILKWTGGQPFLTQKICYSIAQLDVPISDRSEVEIVRNVILTQVVDNWETNDRPEHLATIRNRILQHNEKQIGKLLRIYEQILLKGKIDLDNSPEQMELRLTGLVVKSDNKLKVHNHIYKAVFNRIWLDKALLDLRPYAESLNAWVASRCQDKSRLLQGLALQQALIWSEERNLSGEDRRFLYASQATAKQETELALTQAQEQLRSLQEQKQEAESALTQAQEQLGLLQEQEEQAKLQLKKTLKQVKVVSSLLSVIALIIFIVGVLSWLKQRNDNSILETMKLATANSNAALANNQGLETMVQGVKAVKKLQELDESVGRKNERFQPLQALQQANYQLLEQNRLEGHTDPVSSANFSPDGTKIVTASADKTARVWDLQGNLLKKLSGHTDLVNTANFNHDGTKIVTASADKTARVWNLQGTRQVTLFGHTDLVNSANFSRDGSIIVTASGDKTMRVWDLQGHLLARISGHTDRVNTANFNHDGTKIVTASADKTARVWNLQGHLLARISGHTDRVNSANFSPDGTKIVTASLDKTARVWDLQGNLLVKPFKHRKDVSSANFSLDGTKIVTASEDSIGRVWDLQGNLSKNRLLGHTDPLSSANFSPDGTKIVTASADKTANVWDLQGNLLATLSNPDRVNSANFSLDSTKIVTASANGTVRVWDLQGNLLATLFKYPAEISSANFHPDGTKIVTASADKTARVWDLQGNLLATLSGHTDRVSSANFSPDGTKIVTASADKTARVWDLQGNLLVMLSDHTADVSNANFSPDGTKIVTASVDKTARVWGRLDSLDTKLDQLLKRSCDKLHDYLSTNPKVKQEDRDLCNIKMVKSTIEN